VTVENGEKRKPTAGFLALFVERKIINTSSGFVAQLQKKLLTKIAMLKKEERAWAFISRRDDPFREFKVVPRWLAQIHH
jgi:hypothetical protein